LTIFKVYLSCYVDHLVLHHANHKERQDNKCTQQSLKEKQNQTKQHKQKD